MRVSCVETYIFWAFGSHVEMHHDGDGLQREQELTLDQKKGQKFIINSK